MEITLNGLASTWLLFLFSQYLACGELLSAVGGEAETLFGR